MTQELPKFLAADVSGRTKTLGKDLHDRLDTSGIPEVQALAPQTANALAKDTGAALTLAFVGQYNAGKSTIIKALTGRDDIVIDAGVCTDTVSGYSWHELLLLDTPGVQAGDETHDALTEQAILCADLVVFVITAELFSPASARYFRHLMLDGGKQKESLLVVNKMTLDNGNEEAKRPFLDSVCQPLSSHDFSTVFMDAQCYLDALLCIDERDQLELREASRFDAFMDTLNRFARERCDLGRITQPLFQLRSISQQAAVIAGTDQPAERAAIELLGRLETCIYESKVQLKAQMNGALGRALRQIESAGGDLANAIHDEASEEEIKTSQEACCLTAFAAQAALAEEAKQLIEAEAGTLRENLSAVSCSSLGQQVINDINSGAIKVVPGFTTDFGQTSLPENRFAETAGIDASGLKKGVDVASRLGSLLSNWAVGPNGAGQGFFRAAEVAGGNAHRFVYDAGKFFGKNFKPWEAVKYAKWIGNLGKALGAAGAVISVVVEFRNEQHEQERQLKLADNRNDVRTQFQEMSRNLSDAFWSQYKEFENVQYDGELEALQSMRNQLVGGLAGRTEESQMFVQLGERADGLLRLLFGDEAGA